MPSDLYQESAKEVLYVPTEHAVWSTAANGQQNTVPD